MRKKLCIIILTLAAALIVTGCNEARVSAETTPTPQTSPTTEATTTSASTTTTITTTPPAEEKPAEYIAFFEEEKVHDVYIDISEEYWQSIKTAPEEEKYYLADVTIDGMTVDHVGIRTKGNSSLKHGLWQGLGRFPFHIKFDRYIDGRTFLGLDDMVLNNGTDDASYVREYYGYEAFRQLDMQVPLTAFFNVYLNGELLGFYLGAEVIDGSYLDRVYGDNTRSLYKASEGATLETSMDIELLEGKRGAPDDKADVKKLIEVINATPTGEKGEIEDVLNVDTVLRYFAVCASIHDWDDYCGWFSQNYYFYENNGRFDIIPWDINESFTQTQAFYNESDGARQDIASPLTGWHSIQSRPMAEKLLAVPEYYEKYLEYCCVLSVWLDEVASGGELPRMQSFIGECVAADPTSMFGNYQFTLQFDAAYSDGIAGYITERAAYLKERLPQLTDRYAEITGNELPADTTAAVTEISAAATQETVTTADIAEERDGNFSESMSSDS